MVYGESGVYPLSCIVNMRMINFYMRLVNGKKSKLAYIMYKVIRTQHEQFSSDYKWLNHVKHCLQNIGMGDVWSYHGNGFTSLYIKEAMKLRIKDIFKQNWHEMKSNHDYCNFYDILKTELKMENYLIDLNYQQRVALCKFRCRSNFLPIAYSRFPNESAELCMCPLCNNDVLGDEYHYLFVCPFFEEDRRRFLTIPEHPDIFHAITLFNSDDNKLSIKLSLFVDLIMKIFEHRNEWEDGI